MSSPKDTKWDRGDVARKKNISTEEKEAISSYYEAGLKLGKTSDELLEELSKKYDRSTRQIQRYISQHNERIAEKSLHDDLDEKIIAINTRKKHLDQIQVLIQKWRNSFDTRHRPINSYVLPPIYGVEQERLFPYALNHCPSVNNEYKALLKTRRKYQAQSSELKKSQSERWRQTFIKTESKLRDALGKCLLSHEYSRHRCCLCSPSDG